MGLIGLATLLSGQTTSAHVVDVCLHRVSDAATALKACQLTQQNDGQCDLAAEQLEFHQQKCTQQEFQFTAADIAMAADHGFQHLEGDVHRSPYARQLQKQRWENSLMKPNVESFSRLFPQASQHVGQLTDRFNTSACPNQYEGHSERWLFVQSMNLTRYPMDEDQGVATGYRVYLFAQQKPGLCYGPNPSEQAYKVVNIPELMLLEMEQMSEVRVLRCSHQRCESDIQSFNQIYNQYQHQYREYRQLALCADIDLKNSERKKVKGKLRSKRVLPDYCPTEEVQVKALNAKGALDQLNNRLFEQANIRIKTVKIEEKEAVKVD